MQTDDHEESRIKERKGDWKQNWIIHSLNYFWERLSELCLRGKCYGVSYKQEHWNDGNQSYQNYKTFFSRRKREAKDLVLFIHQEIYVILIGEIIVETNNRQILILTLLCAIISNRKLQVIDNLQSLYQLNSNHSMKPRSNN